MGSRYLTDLDEVCRRTGYPVIEVDDWQYRARGSGGYNSGKPDHVMCHHTGSPPSSDGWGDVNYCTFGDEDAPLANLVLSRVPEIFICAGGATNTNGTGDCPHLSPDTMNSSAIGIEASNHGGEPWNERQQDAYIKLVQQLCSAYNIPHAHVESHAEWAPTRKVDPAGQSAWSPDTGTWDMNLFRGDLGDGGSSTGGFLMALTDQQQKDLYDRVMGSLPGEYSTEQRGSGGSGDGVRRFAMDDQDGNYIVSMLQTIMAKLEEG